jgi:cytochrome c556
MGVSTAINAQNVSVNININLNSQPAWGPVGYEVANFYYFPDLNIYFDINNSLFYYLSGSRWISNRYLPNKYSRYDLYSLYKIVINDDPQPWLNHKVYKKQYSGYKNNRTQTPIRYSTDSKYSNSKNNSTVWVDNSRFEKTNNKGNNKNNSQNSNANNKGNSNNVNKQSGTNNSSKNSNQSGRTKENNNNNKQSQSQGNRQGGR